MPLCLQSLNQCIGAINGERYTANVSVMYMKKLFAHRAGQVIYKALSLAAYHHYPL